MKTVCPGVYLFEDECNVFVVQDGENAIAVDFGSGGFLDELPALGITTLEAVFLTHHHADQCRGLPSERSFVVHAPRGEEAFLDPAQASARTSADAHLGRGCPPSYSVLPAGLTDVRYDMAPAADLFWRGHRIRFIDTPGHGPNALSVVLDIAGLQVIFCGDAVHAGATVWEPFHLEWDHWTAAGALAAWQGVRRLRWAYADLLCPSHGPVLDEEIPTLLDTLSHRLLRFIEVKGGTASWERDLPVTLEPTKGGAQKVLPHLYQFGGNGYLLRSRTGEALVVDPNGGDRRALQALLAELGDPPLTFATATHYHFDHSDDLPYLRERYGTEVVLHPSVAYPLEHQRSLWAPWLPSAPITPDRPAPEDGTVAWNEYALYFQPAPGQTWWHAMISAEIDGASILFAGDTFQPPTRWHGTGGFCAYNRSRFADGVAETCDRVIALSPDIIAAGHGTVCRYSRSRFEKTRLWAAEAESAVADLCPGGDSEAHYFVFPLD